MRTILITGASSGFGKGLVEAFLEKGDRVIATARKLSTRQEIFAGVRGTYGKQLTELDLDIGIETERSAIAAHIQSQGGLDILINNAGYGAFGPVEESTEQNIRRQFEVNFFGPLLLSQSLLPHLRKSHGMLINISSVFGFMGFPMAGLYCASKFALEGLSESLSYELAPHGVRVVLVEPGGYRTNFNKNAEWSMAEFNPKSPYYLQLENYRRFRDKLSTRPNPQKPEEVVKGIVKIASQTKPALRKTFGKDAFGVRVMRGVLTRQLYHKLTTKMFLKLFLKELS